MPYKTGLCFTFWLWQRLKKICRLLHHQRYNHNLRAALAIAKAPSKDLFPPMNPLMWTNTQSGIPHSLESSSSRKPLHDSGRGLRLSNLSGETATACTLHCLALESYKFTTIEDKYFDSSNQQNSLNHPSLHFPSNIAFT